MLNWQLKYKIAALENALNDYKNELENNFTVITDTSIRIIKTNKAH